LHEHSQIKKTICSCSGSHNPLQILDSIFRQVCFAFVVQFDMSTWRGSTKNRAINIMAQRDFKKIVLTGKMNDRGFFRHILKKMKLFLSVDNNGTLLTDKSCRSHTVSDLRIRFFFHAVCCFCQWGATEPSNPRKSSHASILSATSDY